VGQKTPQEVEADNIGEARRKAGGYVSAIEQLEDETKHKEKKDNGSDTE
jgi:hypothetical protein